MKILLLGPERLALQTIMASLGDKVLRTEARLESESTLLDDVDFLVSYGYRHILGEEVLARFPERAINLHISYLPWNRGADPNLWSFLEDTPKGVTIHQLARGLDTGHILAQELVAFHDSDTLKSSYERLCHAMEDLFFRTWPQIRLGKVTPFPQPPGGSYHRLKDREVFEPYLTQGWDTPVNQLIGLALTQEKDCSPCAR